MARAETARQVTEGVTGPSRSHGRCGCGAKRGTAAHLRHCPFLAFLLHNPTSGFCWQSLSTCRRISATAGEIPNEENLSCPVCRRPNTPGVPSAGAPLSGLLGGPRCTTARSIPHTYEGNLWDSRARLLSSRILVHTRLPTDVRVQVPASTLEGL